MVNSCCVALVRWLRNHLCGSAFGMKKQFLKLLTNPNFLSWIRCCGSVLTMFHKLRVARRKMANVTFYLKTLRLRFCGSASETCRCTIFQLNNMVSETLCSGSSYCNNYVFLDSGVPGLAFAAVWRVHPLADWSELALLPRSKQKGILIPSMLL
jgi:hypothetical protein